MSAEAQRWYDEPDLASEAAESRPLSTRGARPAGVERRRRPREQGASWNVLTEELVSFPRPGRHLSLEDLTGVRAPSREHADDGDSARARRYGEEWLQAELRTIRYLADSGYPSLPQRRLLGVEPSVAGDWTDGSSALAVPVPLEDDLAALPARSVPRRAERRPRESSRPVARPVPAPRRLADEAESAPVRAHRVAPSPRGLRRLLPGVATLAALAGIWAGAGALSATHDHPLVVPAGSTRVAGGYSYVVRPGDTLWSIAGRLDPGGDPRPIVARLESELHGRTLVPGMRLVLP